MKNRKTFRLLISLIIILVLGMLACSLLSINNISTDFVESGESRIFQTKSNKAGDNNNSGANVTGYLIGGTDYSLNDQFALKGSVAIPFKSEYSTDITLGVGYKF